ncbi:cartilage intermediate layer protein 2 [Patella vulgata]|uniref:cartilage intermediate layer protein 2 n=1 Tax=Patella vulgata TaxID=6465 RepID=UPI00217F7105|nr:cartilage intermediate layer protein 2 [Patella vulgata]
MKAFAVLVLAVVVYNHAAEGFDCNQWTKFYSRDQPSWTADYEALADIRKENPKDHICAVPSDLDVQTLNGIGYREAREVVKIGPTFGFACYNNQQPDGHCLDYKVRFCCMQQTPTCKKWTQFYNRDSPSASGDWETLNELRKAHPSLCANPSAIDVRLVKTGKDFRTANEVVSVYPSRGFWCQNKLQKDKYCENYKVRFCCP